MELKTVVYEAADRTSLCRPLKKTVVVKSAE